MQLSVVILAAGQGRRMNSDLPKVLQPVAGRPLLKHVIDAARALRPQAVYVVYGHGGAEVQAALSNEAVDWVLQAEQLGTGHAVMQAMPMIPDDHLVLVLYGDVPLISGGTLSRLISAAGPDGAALLSAELDNPDGYGRLLRGVDGGVVAIVEHKDASLDERRIREINAGVVAAPARRLREWLLGLSNANSQQEYYLTDVVAAAAAAHVRVASVPAASPAEILGVNDKIQLAEAEAGFRQARARELLLAGATLADPARIDVRGTLEVGRDVFIDVNAVFEGSVRLGARVRIGPNCLIRDSEIGEGAQIQANSVLDGADVAAQCIVGPFARLRPGTRLHGGVHVGNFVEVKNSEIGAGSKANHLSYVGDARLGAGVNIGAGTITCNYDGANKWPTLIEDRAFIGSGSMLVAPLRVGADATIGAGSTIAEGAPDGQLTLTRARQTTVKGWKRTPKLSEAERDALIAEALKKPKD